MVDTESKQNKQKQNDVYIYIERKTSSSKLTKLGKKVLLTNNVLILEIDNLGILKSKKLALPTNLGGVKKNKKYLNFFFSIISIFGELRANIGGWKLFQ